MIFLLIFLTTSINFIVAQNCVGVTCQGAQVANFYSGHCICECPNEPDCCDDDDILSYFDPITCKKVTSLPQIQNLTATFIDRVFVDAETKVLPPILPVIAAYNVLSAEAKNLVATMDVHAPSVAQFLNQFSEFLMTEQVPISSALTVLNGIFPQAEIEVTKFLQAWSRFFNCQSCATSYDSLFSAFSTFNFTSPFNFFANINDPLAFINNFLG